jgi:hypothetical protein
VINSLLAVVLVPTRHHPRAGCVFKIGSVQSGMCRSTPGVASCPRHRGASQRSVSSQRSGLPGHACPALLARSQCSAAKGRPCVFPERTLQMPITMRNLTPDLSTRSDDNRKAALREFLMRCRARLLPADVGVVSFGRRRVPGLRREEVAELAGITPTGSNSVSSFRVGGKRSAHAARGKTNRA